jgi:ELWxxDGT repeat protein
MKQKTENKQISIFALIVISLFLINGCGNQNSTQEEKNSQPNHLQLNVKLNNSGIEKTSYQKSTNIDSMTLDVENSGNSIYTKYPLSKDSNGKWGGNLFLTPDTYDFTVHAFSNGSMIYKGETTQTISSKSSDINITLASTETTLTYLPFIKPEDIIKTTTPQGTIQLTFKVTNYQKDSLGYLLTPNIPNVASCKNPFTPSTGTLTFGGGTTTTDSFNTTLTPDSNLSCQTNSYKLFLSNSVNPDRDIVIYTFTLDSNNLNINLPPDINRVYVSDNNSSFELYLDAYDPEGSSSLKYSWKILTNNAQVVSSSDRKNPLIIDNYDGLQPIVIDVNISDDQGASSRIYYILHGELNSGGNVIGGSSPTQKLRFTYYNSNSKKRELWQLNQSGQLILIKELGESKKGYFGDIYIFNPQSNPTTINGVQYFVAKTDATGEELWRTDGQSSGTEIVKDIYPGSGDSNPSKLTTLNGKLYFSAYNNDTNGYELWESDGTEKGTKMVKDIYQGTAHSNPSYLTTLNGKLYFSANTGTNGDELWMSDGTEKGTKMVKDISKGGSYSNPRYLTTINGKLYFSADDGKNGSELWESNGTADGTKMVKDILKGIDSSNPYELTTLNGKLYFSANTGKNGDEELWESDGTEKGTVKIFPFKP